MKLRSGALLIGLSIVLVSLACSTETIKEVPVDRIVTQEVIKEVPVEKIVTVVKEVVRTVEVEKPVEVIREVVKEVKVPGKTIVVEVEKEVIRTIEVEKPVIVTQMIVATPTAVPAGAGPSGTLVVADSDIAFPNLIPCKFAYNPQDNVHRWSIFDTAMYFGFDEPGISLIGLGESWSYNADQTVLTWKTRKGVEFDGGWGAVTAKDWEWSWNEQHCDGSLHSNVFISKTYTDQTNPTNVLDDYTIQFNLTEPNIFYLDKFQGPGGGGSFTIFSKAKSDALGEQKADRSLTGGTGPFKLVKWSPGDEIVTEARNDHYRRVPEYRTFRIVEIPEAATQVAALMAGEVDVAEMPTIDASRVAGAGVNVIKLLGDGPSQIIMQGRFCFEPQGELDGIGNPVPARPGYDPSKAWIGSCDPDSPEWENARKVRNAVAMAINREAIVENILGGFGFAGAKPGFMYKQQVDRYLPMAEAQGLDWNNKYDPAAAKALLAEAGWSDGFDVTMRVTTGGHPLAIEMGETIARDLAEIGITVNLQVLTYTGNRPAVVARENGDWWFQSDAGGAPSAAFPTTETWAHRRPPEAAFNNGWEIPEAVRLSKAMEQCETQQCLDENRIAMFKFWADDQGYVSVVNSFGAMGISDKVGDWRQPLGIGIHPANRFSLEYIQKPR
jgi:ABC-type transport system substrate-binding protein